MLAKLVGGPPERLPLVYSSVEKSYRMSLGRIAGPVWAGFVFDVNVNYPYLSGAAIMFVGFLTSLAWVAPHLTDEPKARII